MAAHQAPPSLGFPRQEYWSGLPFPSPMHESEKWKWSQSCLTLRDPTDCSLPGSFVHGIFQSRVLEWGAIASPRDSDLITPGYVSDIGHVSKYPWVIVICIQAWEWLSQSAGNIFPPTVLIAAVSHLIPTKRSTQSWEYEQFLSSYYTALPEVRENPGPWNYHWCLMWTSKFFKQ